MYEDGIDNAVSVATQQVDNLSIMSNPSITTYHIDESQHEEANFVEEVIPT